MTGIGTEKRERGNSPGWSGALDLARGDTRRRKPESLTFPVRFKIIGDSGLGGGRLGRSRETTPPLDGEERVLNHTSFN